MSVEKLKSLVSYYHNSPADISTAILDVLSDATDGDIEISDPNNPFIFLLESAATAVSVAIEKDEARCRKLYPELATTYDDIRNHSSDEDLSGYFAQPCRNVTLTLLLSYDNIEQYSVIDSVSGLPKIVIPGDTRWSVRGINFYHHHPIVITKLPHGEYQTLLDLSKSNPLSSPSSNVVESFVTNMRGYKYLCLKIKADQLTVTTENYSVSDTSGFTNSVIFQDKYFYARVYNLNSSNYWEEIKTSYTTQVYDANIPTALLEVNETILKVTIPDIYFTNGKIGDTIRVDVYTTVGEIDLKLSELPTAAFSYNWLNYSGVNKEFVAPLYKFSDISIFSDMDAVGGEDSVDFQELRNRIIYGDGNQVPIGYKRLQNYVSDRGLKLTKLRENVLGRSYLGTSTIGNLNLLPTISGIGCSHSTVEVDVLRNDLSGSMINNGNRSTLLPDALYKRIEGGYALQASGIKTYLDSLSDDSRTKIMNEFVYLYNPFFTVLDETNNTFSVRSYYLDNPVEVSRSFIGSKPEIGYSVNTASFKVARNNSGFTFTVLTDVPDGLTGLSLQLIFISPTSERWTITAAQEIVTPKVSRFTFNVESNFDITFDHRLFFTNLLDLNGSEGVTFVDLECKVDLIYIVESSSGLGNSFGNIFNEAAFDVDIVPITYERSSVKLGTHMNNYYVEGRTVASQVIYQTHPVTIYKTYSEDVYLKDATGPVVTYVDGVPTLTKLHSRGDYILDGGGNKIIEHEEGSFMYDENFLPIVLEPSKMVREVTMPLFDARILYCTESLSVAYKSAYPRYIVNFLSETISGIVDNLIEGTVLPYAPVNNFSKAKAKTSSNVTEVIDVSISYEVTINIMDRGYYNTELRSLIASTISRIINAKLATGVHSESALLFNIMSEMPEEVLGIVVKSDLSDYPYASLEEGPNGFALANRLSIRSDGTVTMADDIEYVWKVT